MKMSIEKIPPYRIAFIRRVGAYGVENIATMENLKSWAKSNGLLDKHSVLLSIAHDNPQFTKPENCRYDTCVVLSDDFEVNSNENISEGNISGGEYAVFQIEHTAEGLQKVWTTIFAELQSQNLRLDDKRPIIERYLAELVENHLCELCVPIS